MTRRPAVSVQLMVSAYFFDILPSASVVALLVTERCFLLGIHVHSGGRIQLHNQLQYSTGQETKVNQSPAQRNKFVLCSSTLRLQYIYLFSSLHVCWDVSICDCSAGGKSCATLY